VFRNGAVESVYVWDAEGKAIPSTAYEGRTLTAVREWLPQLRAWGASGPLSVGLAFLGVKGWELAAPKELFWADPITTTIRRDDLILPMTGADSLDRTADEIMRPTFDLVWNAFGVTHSINFDSDGKWDPDHWKRRRT
jgi:hypothetical protein